MFSGVNPTPTASHESDALHFNSLNIYQLKSKKNPFKGSKPLKESIRAILAIA